MPADREAVPAPVRDRLRAARGFVFDMDGTLVLGDRHGHGLRPLPGALAITGWMAAQRVPFVILTNGTARPPHQYAEKLRGAGFGVTDEAVMTPASSAVVVCLRRGHRRVVVLGNDGLKQPLREAKIEVVPPEGRPDADAVLAGWHPGFTMSELESACHAVWGGAVLYSCSQSIFFASADGKTLGTSRAITAMIKSLTGCRVEIVGKPSLHALRSAGVRLGVRPEDLAVVGDDPALEVPMAHSGHALAVAVRTGIGADGSFDRLPAGRAPHLTLPGVADLLSLCQQVRTPTQQPGSPRPVVT
jgi:HAD superfamily hydrolase (TIGR01450 family)